MRNFSFVICGVNPYVIEIPEINEIQNPIFGIVSPVYIRGLDREDNSRMIRYVGKRMGILLDANAISFLQNEFGGHPLLTRIVCSKIHQYINLKIYNGHFLLMSILLRPLLDRRMLKLNHIALI